MPSSLRQRQLRRQQNQAATQTAETAHLDFVGDPAFQEDPITLGILKSTGRTLALIKRGNTKGMSPTWSVNDEYGNPSIQRLGDVIDTGMLSGPIPISAEQVEQIYSNLKFKDEPPV